MAEKEKESSEDILTLISCTSGIYKSIPKEDLPLIINYKGKKYVLILTKNDKLILQKAIT